MRVQRNAAEPARADPPTSSETSGRRRDIQGLRAVAVLLVVAFHAGLPIPGGFVGVDVFFVISGFVITMVLLREWQEAGRIRLSSFYVRRFKRLTPALAATVTAVMLASILLSSPIRAQEVAALTGIGAILLVANFVIAHLSGGYFDVAAELNPLLNTWSLSVEEQFYLLFPAVLAASLAVRLRRTSKLARAFAPSAVLLILLLSFTAAVANGFGLFGTRLSLLFGFYGPLSRAWEFAVGALLVFALPRMHPFLNRDTARVLLRWGGIALLALSVFAITENTPFPSLWTLLPVVATASLILAGSGQASSEARVLSSQPMVVLGDWSYSIYLWHWPLITFAVVLWPASPIAALGAAAVAFPIAAASYRWLENPVRRSSALGGRRLARIFILTITPPLASALVLLSVAGPLRPSAVDTFNEALGPPHEVTLRGCDSGAPMDAETVKTCTWNTVASGSPVYLLGDSNAGHFIEGISNAADATGRPLVAVTSNSCPLVGVALHDARASRAWNQTCARYVEQSIDYLKDAAPGTVVLASSDFYWNSDRFTTSVSDSGGSSSRGSLAETVTPFFTRMVEILQRHGHSVVLIGTVPQWVGDESWSPEGCTATSVWAGRCERTASAESLRRAQSQGQALIESVAQTTNSDVIDLWDTLCLGDTCRTGREDFQSYKDAGHLTVAQSRALGPLFVEILTQTDFPSADGPRP